MVCLLCSPSSSSSCVVLVIISLHICTTWSARSPLVGLTVSAHCSHTLADHEAAAVAIKASTGRRPRTATPVHSITIEAVSATGGGPAFQCWGRLNDDDGLLVFFTRMQTLGEAAYAHDYPGQPVRNRRLFDRARLLLAQPPTPAGGGFPDTHLAMRLSSEVLRLFSAW